MNSATGDRRLVTTKKESVVFAFISTEAASECVCVWGGGGVATATYKRKDIITNVIGQRRPKDTFFPK